MVVKKKKQIKIKDINNNLNESYLLELLANKNWEKIIEIYKNPRDIKINGNNLLHLACSRGEVNSINYYLLKYPELFYVANNEGDTCAHILVKYGYYDILKKLVPKFPEAIHFINKDGANLLDLTVNEPQIMNWLINLIDPEYFKEMDSSKIASLKSLVELIKLNNGQDLYLHLINKLVNKGFQLNQPSPFSPLIIASKLDKPEVTETLLKAGADPNIRDINELTPIIRAVENSSYNSIKYLLDYGADINYGGPEGDHFPLNIALNNKDNKMVEIILDKNINYNFKNRNLDTPIHIALQNELEQNFLKPSLLFKLIHESDLNLPNIKNSTPLHLLGRYSKNNNILNYSTILKKKKLDITIKDNNNKTPLYYLSRNVKTIFNINENSYVNETKNNIIMPKLKNNNFGLFNSDILHNVIYTVMILRKYKNLAIPTITKNYDKYIKEYDNFNIYSNYKSSEGKLMKDIISIYYDNFYNIIPYLILWKSRDLYYYNENLEVSIKKLLKNEKIDFIFIKLSLIPNFNSTHANILIYDKKNNILERFEPYGPNDMLDEKELNKFIEKLSKKIFNKKVKFIYPKLFMEETKFQIVSSDSDPSNKKIGDPIGYCLAWCFWYLELRLNNPKLSSKKLVNNAFDKILKSKNPDSNQVLNYIRNYSQELDKLKNIFLKECNIPESEYYNNNYDNKIIEKILSKLLKNI